ncbi:hypothetical protein [Flavitalea sp.]|nr:hypothetical protein [Flavitalea sp.]
MPVITLVLFLYVLLYFVLAGQAVFYKLCFTHVFKKIPAQQFINIRKLADPILETRLPVIYYSSLAFGITFIILAVYQGSAITIIFAALAFIFLLADVMLAKKYNIPINAEIRNLVNPSDMIAARLQHDWIRWIDIRGNFILAGFFVLTIYTVL